MIEAAGAVSIFFELDVVEAVPFKPVKDLGKVIQNTSQL
jgi:hypothetical protein